MCARLGVACVCLWESKHKPYVGVWKREKLKKQKNVQIQTKPSKWDKNICFVSFVSTENSKKFQIHFTRFSDDWILRRHSHRLLFVVKWKTFTRNAKNIWYVIIMGLRLGSTAFDDSSEPTAISHSLLLLLHSDPYYTHIRFINQPNGNKIIIFIIRDLSLPFFLCNQSGIVSCRHRAL